MISIIEKLDRLREPDKGFDSWTLKEKQLFLQLYYKISCIETKIFDMIYTYHGCDSWEDIFRDYDENLLHEKARGVKIALDEISERIEDTEDAEPK